MLGVREFRDCFPDKWQDMYHEYVLASPKSGIRKAYEEAVEALKSESMVDDDELTLKAKKAARFEVLKSIFIDRYRKEFREATYRGKCKFIQEALDDFKSSFESKQSDTFGVTINPMSDIDVPDFISRIRKIAERPYVKSVKWCLETRSDDGTCTGVHAHAFVTLTTVQTKNQLHTFLKGSFRKFCGNDQHIVCKTLSSEAYKEAQEKYVGKEKHADDKIIRAKYGLKDSEEI